MESGTGESDNFSVNHTDYQGWLCPYNVNFIGDEAPCNSQKCGEDVGEPLQRPEIICGPQRGMDRTVARTNVNKWIFWKPGKARFQNLEQCNFPPAFNSRCTHSLHVVNPPLLRCTVLYASADFQVLQPCCNPLYNSDVATMMLQCRKRHRSVHYCSVDVYARAESGALLVTRRKPFNKCMVNRSAWSPPVSPRWLYHRSFSHPLLIVSKPSGWASSLPILVNIREGDCGLDCSSIKVKMLFCRLCSKNDGFRALDQARPARSVPWLP